MSDQTIPNPGPGYRLLNTATDATLIAGDNIWINGEWCECFGSSNAIHGGIFYRRRVTEAEETVALLNELLAGDEVVRIELSCGHYEVERNDDSQWYPATNLLDALRATAKAKREAGE